MYMDSFNNDNLKIIDIPLEGMPINNNDSNIETINDAYILSLTNFGKVDINYISSLTKKTPREIINSLKGVIYQNPLTWNEDYRLGWETSDEYLSGNLRRKLRIAREANKKYNGYFENNIKALRSLITTSLTTDDIYITLGSPWIPSEYIHDFILYVLYEAGSIKSNVKIQKWRFNNYVRHDMKTGTWQILNKSCYGNYQRRRHNLFSTRRIEVLELIERTLNMKSPIIRDKAYSPFTKSHLASVVNKNETALAIDAQNRLIEEFQKWVWNDKERRETLSYIYEELYTSTKIRHFDGSFLTFPGLDKNTISLRTYQKNAVARILFTPNTLLAHDVGAGKTFIMIAAGMELKRMGLSKKNLYVVPNNILIQWKNMFKKLYPDSDVLTITPRMFRPAERKEYLKKIRDEKYDAIIISYSSFEQIKLSKQYIINKLVNEKNELNNLDSHISSISVRKTYLDKKIQELIMSMPDDQEDEIYFDQLGITRLFVDEAHNFKNVPIDSKSNGILGINFTGSKKCEQMLDKVRCVQKENNGGGIVFATGTPITNSITDAYVMQYYLQKGELKLLGLESFDAWIGMFAERHTEFEIDVDTSSYRIATRFSRFHNLPELTTMFASIADFHQLEHKDGLPLFNDYTDEKISKSSELSLYLKDISKRAEKVRKGKVSRKDDNLLKITTDGRKAALDIRLVKSSAKMSIDSKVMACASNVARIYKETYEQKCAQLIFCDTSTPKNEFNIYDELRRILVSLGVNDLEIAYVHDATTESKKETLFKQVSKGEIRILIGSTFKLGLGVNVQEKLIALHHIDVPWRPADMRQREGRILRQGNTNKEVKIFRYITEGSFDAYSWQLLETKQRFIDDLLSGSISDRCSNDVSDTVLNYAEIKALAIGNPLIKERVETVNELNKYKMLQNREEEKRANNLAAQASLPGEIEKQKEIIANVELDINSYKDYKNVEVAVDKLPKEEKEKYDEERKRLRELINESLKTNILSKSEKTLLTYKGFKIVLPINMLFDSPYIYLIRSNRYRVEMGYSETGNMTRIDNFLDNLENYLEDHKNALKRLNEERILVMKELSHPVDYKVDIENLTIKLDKLDKKLGVKEDEK